MTTERGVVRSRDLFNFGGQIIFVTSSHAGIGTAEARVVKFCTQVAYVVAYG